MDGLVQSLEKLYDELTAVALMTHTLEKEAKALRNPYTEVYKLRSQARHFFGKDEASLKDMVQHLLSEWKASRSLSANGRSVTLGKEAKLLGFKEHQEIDIYQVYEALQTLQKHKN